jgi:predicted nucleic acid-binding protein
MVLGYERLFSLLSSDDPKHERAKEFAASGSREQIRFVTTDWIIGETCTLLMARRKAHLIPIFLDHIETASSIATIHLDPQFLQSARNYLRKHLDHGYSFTDCTSFVLMRQRGINDAVTSDEHFIEAAFVALLR